VRAGPDIDERRPSIAAEYLRVAQQNDLVFIFSNIVEPGRFPKDSNKDNVDQWLDRRLSETVAVIQQNKPRRPVFLQFNQAWAFDKPEVRWNPGRNPLKDKYGEQWLGEYFYKAMNVPVSKGLTPNVDFITFINDNLDKHRYNETSLQFVHDKIAEARRYAFAKLQNDEVIAGKLNGMGIKRPEDINIIFGSQTYVNLDNRPIGRFDQNGVNFISDPIKEQVDDLANIFGDMGGILLTTYPKSNSGLACRWG